jgi:hypothetical protein
MMSLNSHSGHRPGPRQRLVDARRQQPRSTSLAFKERDGAGKSSQFIQPYRNRAKLVRPVVTNGAAPMGLARLDAFFSGRYRLPDRRGRDPHLELGYEHRVLPEEGFYSAVP